MTTTTGQPERSQWSTGDPRAWFVQDAITARGYVVYAGEDDPGPEPEYFNATEDPDYQPAGGKRSQRSEAAALAAIADALGTPVDELRELDVDVNGLDDAIDVIRHDLDDPQSALQALDAALDRKCQEKSAPGESDLAYRVREGNWREQHGLPRKPKSVPPSRTPEARRTRHLQGLVDAGKFPDVQTADRMTPRRVHHPRSDAKTSGW